MRASDKVNGNGWVPPWMLELGVEANGAVTVSKAQLRSLMRPCNKLKVQVWACGMLHTDGYNGQVAYIAEDGEKKRPLRSQDIRRILHIEAKKYYRGAGVKDGGLFAALKEEKQEIRRALESLDADGVSERQVDDGRLFASLSVEERQKLPNSRTRICFFVKPKPADPGKVQKEWADLQAALSDDGQQSPVGKTCLPPPSISQTLKLFRIEIPEKDEISPEIYQKAYSRAREVFIEALQIHPEVGKECLPTVGAECPPEVGKGCVTIRKDSSKSYKETPPPTDRPLTRATVATSERVGRSVEVPAQSFQDSIRNWLTETFPVPHALDNVVLRSIAAACVDPAGLAQFQEACQEEKRKFHSGYTGNPIRGWKYFEKIAVRCASHRETYQQAKAKGASTEDESPYVRLRREARENGG